MAVRSVTVRSVTVRNVTVRNVAVRIVAVEAKELAAAACAHALRGGGVASEVVCERAGARSPFFAK